jgi:hypothetical protein
MSRLSRDAAGGLLMVLVGAGAAVHASTFELGTLRHMGPGFVPMTVGVLLALVGVALAVSGWAAAPTAAVAPAPRAQWRAWGLICLGLVAFILLTGRFGLAAGTFGLVFIAALADRENDWRRAGVLALTMVAVTALVFWWALRVQLPLFGGL